MGAAAQIKGQVKIAIEVVGGPHIGLRLDFNKDTISIGRGPENDVVLANDPHVSRAHAEIRRRNVADFVIVNVSQKNFILVNGNAVESELLTPDCEIQIGETEIRCHIENAVVPVVHQPPVMQVVPPMPVANPIASKPPSPVATPMPPVGPPPVMRQNQYVPPPSSGPLDNSRIRFYGVIAIVALVGYFLLSPSKKNKAKDRNEIRTSTISMQDFQQAEKRSQELLTMKKEKYDSVQYRRAQENFVKGFRDFQQGQYARAREAFQVVLNLDPDNELARRYYNLSKIKFDELVKFNMIQGNRYREKKNWRMCQSSYQNVMTMLISKKDDSTYKEAKQYFEECKLNLEGRF